MTKFAHDDIVPDKASNLDKKEQVATMFNDIAPDPVRGTHKPPAILLV